jgi:hypothetical protein
MSRKILPMAILVGVLLMPPVVVGEAYYKWVDAQGQVHYSDQQPQTGVENVEVVDLPGLPAETSQVPVPDQNLKSIKALAQELAQQLETGVGQDPKKTRELAQELVQQLEATTDQGLGRIQELARELRRQLETDTDREPGRIQKMARNLVQEIETYATAVTMRSSTPAQELERIQQLTQEWEAQRKNLEAEREALEEKQRQESLVYRQEEQQAPVQQGTTIWWPFISYDSCFLHPEICNPCRLHPERCFDPCRRHPEICNPCFLHPERCKKQELLHHQPVRPPEQPKPWPCKKPSPVYKSHSGWAPSCSP